MCKTISDDGVNTDFPAKGGEKWFIRGEEFTVGTTHQKYFETNGDPDTLYLSMRNSTGKGFVITHKAFLDKAKREEPIIERYITPNKFLSSKPCDQGIWAFGVATGYFSAKGMPENPMFELTKAVAIGKVLNNSWKISDLYHNFMVKTHEPISTDWLLWMAKLLDLVPKTSSGPDRGTLLRLLGIRE